MEIGGDEFCTTELIVTMREEIRILGKRRRLLGTAGVERSHNSGEPKLEAFSHSFCLCFLIKCELRIVYILGTEGEESVTQRL